VIVVGSWSRRSRRRLFEHDRVADHVHVPDHVHVDVDVDVTFTSTSRADVDLWRSPIQRNHARNARLRDKVLTSARAEGPVVGSRWKCCNLPTALGINA